MAILKIGLYPRKPCPDSKNKLTLDPLVEREYMYNFWNFGHLPIFMPKYVNFENQPVARKLLPIEQK